MPNQPKDDPVRGALAAMIFAVTRNLSDGQREDFANDLYSQAQAAGSAGQPKTRELVDWMHRAAQFSRKWHSAH